MEDQREVGSLSRRTHGPYPPHYKTAFACSLLLYPHRCRRALRPSYPHGGDTGLPCSVPMTLWFRPSQLMPLQSPLPQRFEDGVIDLTEDALADHMTVIHRPTAQHSIEICYQLPCWIRLRLLYDLPNLLKKRMDVLLGRLDQQLTVTVTANVLTEEVEALLDMRDDRLLR